MARKSYSIELAERVAKNKPITAISIRYQGNIASIIYAWEDRKKIAWNNVTRCTLIFSKPKSYLINGEACKRPGIRLKPE